MRKLAIIALVSTLFIAGGVFAQQKAGKDGVYEELNFFDEAFERIRQDSVDSVSDTKLIDSAISGMLTGLDPRSSFLDEAAFKALQTPANDNQASLGLVVTIENGQLKVISPQDGSPAAQAGVTPGDVIFSIDKEPTYDLTLGEAEQKLRGPSGSEVALTLRRGNGGPIDLKMKREPFKLQTVAGRVEGGNIGYLRVAGFDATTQTALAGTVQDLRQRAGNKLIGFILDLRNNPGGNFDAAVATADALIEKGDIVVVKGRKPAATKRISATPGDIAKGLPIVVLTNGGTAREAELVVGALQDNRRAVTLGTKSFGESSIESMIPLGNGGAIRLTTARFTSPNGREIQGKGLEPDLGVSSLKLAKLGRGEGRHEADLPGALKNPDQPATPPANAPPGATATPAPEEAPSVATGDMGSTSDEQLTQAVDVLRGLSLIGKRAAG
ncbi:MAG TPA: S41 family peptidase [Stellaceae bacterium]|jgi:carboxyl-terminal processing protease|nr:S41 family peptidase [Stellaceae bacterium]